MSNDFFHSSPSRHVIDPAIYNESPGNGGLNKDSNTSTTATAKKANNSSSNSKLTNQMTPSNFTGWTPLISKTISNEQLLNYNTTPSTKFLNSIFSTTNGNQQQVIPQSDIDYSNGLNLTPFLNQNLNSLGQNSGTGGVTFTPFHDKSLHLTDFFMDSPIRQTPIKDTETITPSKFRIGSDKKPIKPSIFQDPKSIKKKQINQIDPNVKQPHKLSITTKANDLSSNPNKDEIDNDPRKINDKENDNNDANDQKFEKSKGILLNLQTPSKISLGENSHNYLNKITPLKNTINDKFQTPAKPTEASSPSTVILSSADKSPNKDNDSKENAPLSPTPNKTTVDDSKPMMGVFSEKNPKPKSRNDNFRINKKPLSNQNQNRMNIPHTRFKNTNKAQMQAGMNKFQVVFSDSGVSKRKKSKRVASSSSNNDNQKRNTRDKKEEQNNVSNVSSNQNYHQVTNSFDHHNSQKFNLSDNMSLNKDSSIMSGNNNSMNVSHGNVSSATDHTSFEGISSTPNTKIFLDKMFEKPSPQSQQILNQMFMQQNYNNNMPPPPSAKLNSTNHNPTMMMMSTPQHQNMYTPYQSGDLQDNEHLNISYSH